jgi:hypothetical protein
VKSVQSRTKIIKRDWSERRNLGNLDCNAELQPVKVSVELTPRDAGNIAD